MVSNVEHGASAPRLGLGCANLASMAAGAGGRRSVDLVRHALDRGVTLVDTADAYGDGRSERVLGRALRHRREDVTIATKVGFQFAERSRFEQAARVVLRPVTGRLKSRMSRVAETAKGPAYVAKDFSLGHLRKSLDDSLHRLGTEYIDIYQLHEPADGPTDEILDWAAAVVAAGKVRLFGISVESGEQGVPWLEHDIVGCVQTPFGVVRPEAGADLLPEWHRTGRFVMVRGVLGAGALDDRLTMADVRQRTDRWGMVEELRALARELSVNVAQLGFWFVRQHLNVDAFLVGISSVTHADFAIDATSRPMPSAEVLAAINEIVARPTRA